MIVGPEGGGSVFDRIGSEGPFDFGEPAALLGGMRFPSPFDESSGGADGGEEFLDGDIEDAGEGEGGLDGGDESADFDGADGGAGDFGAGGEFSLGPGETLAVFADAVEGFFGV